MQNNEHGVGKVANAQCLQTNLACKWVKSQRRGTALPGYVALCTSNLPLQEMLGTPGFGGGFSW